MYHKNRKIQYENRKIHCLLGSVFLCCFVKGAMCMQAISLQMYTMREHTKTMSDLENTLERLKDIGLSTLQYTVPPAFDADEVAGLFANRGLKNDSVYCDSKQLEENLNSVLHQCELFDTHYVRLNSMPSALAVTPDGFKTYAQHLNEACGEYKKHDVKLLYHFHAFEFIRFGDTTGIEIILQETDPEAIQIIPDTHWIHSGGKSVVDFLRQYKERYDYVHVKDYQIGRRGPTLECYPIQFAPVGEGNLDWKAMLAVSRKRREKLRH